ncbi:hypothetical protein [Nannocystis punicea]|uniref:Calx-beta domain-containing protein n=1 Tax=Nannocystis punicea TaxID=2995304 RepID=A0ABY7GS85_9BACT|nr:hypothetical protein [Nannocystis poenicansa]WAS89817.1 hypothetical protein O0S08_26800 [Nannocystis poenicansa]
MHDKRSKFLAAAVAAGVFVTSSPSFAQGVPWSITLDQLGCREQTDDPELTENDEVFFVITVTRTDGTSTVATFPSDLEITIAEGEVRTMGVVIASGDLAVNDSVLVTIAMYENDVSDIGTFIANLGGAIQPVGQAACAFDPIGCVTSNAGSLAVALGNAIKNIGLGSGNPFLGSFSVSVQNMGAGLATNWMPGVGLATIDANWPLFFQGVAYAGWSFLDYSDGAFWATFTLQFGQPHP